MKPIVVADPRNPSAGAMQALCVRLPADEISRLQQQAERLQCYPTALARTLISSGLDQLETN